MGDKVLDLLFVVSLLMLPVGIGWIVAIYRREGRDRARSYDLEGFTARMGFFDFGGFRVQLDSGSGKVAFEPLEPPEGVEEMYLASATFKGELPGGPGPFNFGDAVVDRFFGTRFINRSAASFVDSNSEALATLRGFLERHRGKFLSIKASGKSVVFEFRHGRHDAFKQGFCPKELVEELASEMGLFSRALYDVFARPVGQPAQRQRSRKVAPGGYSLVEHYRRQVDSWLFHTLTAPVTLMVSAIALCGSLYGLVTAGLAEESAAWPHTRGRVTSARVVKHTSNSGSGSDHRTSRSSSSHYTTDVEYTFTIAGTAYSEDRVRFSKRTYSTRGEATGALTLYPPGKPVRVYYRPSDPSISVLERGVQPRTRADLWGWGVLAFLGLLAGTGCLVLSASQRAAVRRYRSGGSPSTPQPSKERGYRG